MNYFNSLLLLSPTTEASGASPQTIGGDSFGGGDGYSAADFMKEAAELEAPNVIDEAESHDEELAPAAEESSEETPPPEEPSPSSTGQPLKPPGAPQKSVRKFDGLADDEIPLFKQMSNAAYDKLYPAYLAHKESQTTQESLRKELETANAKRFYEEDGAWNLHPEVKAYQQNLNDLDTESSFWEEQLTNIRNNEPWYELASVNGKYQYGTKHDPSPQGEARVMRFISEASAMRGQLQEKLNGITSTFKTRYQSMDKGVRTVLDSMFSSLDMKQPHISKPYEENLAKFPSELRSNPLAQGLAKADVVIQGLMKLLRSKEISSENKAAAKKVVVRQGPGPGGAVGSGNGQSTADIDKRFQAMTGSPMK